MNKLIVVSLSGQAAQLQMEEDAYEALRRYLDRASSRLKSDPDHAEVMGDLERSIGEKLNAIVGSDPRVITAADIDVVLAQVGSVDVGEEPIAYGAPEHRRVRRRLTRIREGQAIAGVCTGLAAYADLSLDMVRWIFALATVFTAGIFLVVYLVLMFVLPVVATRQEYFASLEPIEDARAR